ncbi:MAG: hypothetical protein HOO67_01740, partial [Candidatus Peribacteraceae bacterium]|nr:hypothetical protein [Candidatus Peribacteraceae bacterium]
MATEVRESPAGRVLGNSDVTQGFESASSLNDNHTPLPGSIKSAAFEVNSEEISLEEMRQWLKDTDTLSFFEKSLDGFAGPINTDQLVDFFSRSVDS